MLDYEKASLEMRQLCITCKHRNAQHARPIDTWFLSDRMICGVTWCNCQRFIKAEAVRDAK